MPLLPVAVQPAPAPAFVSVDKQSEAKGERSHIKKHKQASLFCRVRLFANLAVTSFSWSRPFSKQNVDKNILHRLFLNVPESRGPLIWSPGYAGSGWCAGLRGGRQPAF